MNTSVVAAAAAVAKISIFKLPTYIYMSQSTCTAAFATKDRLRTHMVRHEGKVSCNICGKLLSAAYITSHLKTHGQSQSINCNTCKQGKKFQDKVVLCNFENADPC
ncbi:hypothetical protein AB205_0201860 [Aquarana catesbeiana]|uniref:C2H2-type domain-containing protein n=1 Tax=Aquarana catesbeiana TaxID=8400 RepID=A0A2G9QM81_AQUCT|nr:hypothetical protein AB205_0201860 [Aquarana catesbeiana]